MTTPRFFFALLVSHGTVALVAWACGWVAGRLSGRRDADLGWRRPIPVCDLADLVEPEPAYDWAALNSGLADPPSSWPAVITATGNKPTGRLA